MKKRVTRSCVHCTDQIEIHHITKHQRTCYLNPGNLKLITTYLQRGLSDAKVLNRASFYRWAKENNVMTSVWITKRMGLDKWVQAAYQLLIYAYLRKNISFEKADLILSVLTDGTMWHEYNYHRQLNKEARQHELNGDSASLHANFMALLASVVMRAKRDIWYYEDDLDDENCEINHVEDAVGFLFHFAPEVLQHCIKHNQINSEALKHVAVLESDMSYSDSQLCN